MSFEGYFQTVCARGHLNEPPYDYNFGGLNPEDSHCDCGAMLIWVNRVDDTNCDEWGKVELQTEWAGDFNEVRELPPADHEGWLITDVTLDDFTRITMNPVDVGEVVRYHNYRPPNEEEPGPFCALCGKTLQHSITLIVKNQDDEEAEVHTDCLEFKPMKS